MSAILAELTVSGSGDWELLLLFIPAALVLWWVARQFDLYRIRSYGTERGWRFEEISYRFFGAGWFGEGEERFYDVRYVDAQGVQHEAKCKTRMFTGVYFTEVRSTGRVARPAAWDARAANAIDCPRCGAMVGAADAACPNCREPRAREARRLSA